MGHSQLRTHLNFYLPVGAAVTRLDIASQMAPLRRLAQLVRELTPAPASVGTLKLGDITFEVPASSTPSRLAHTSQLVDIHDPVNVDNLHFMLQKYLLGQDIFLVSQPGPYARRLALTFARYALLLSLRWSGFNRRSAAL